jgi:predicted phosphodiesterase
VISLTEKKKMKVKVWSDLHLEFRDYMFDHIHLEHPDDKETILLLAGDISTGITAMPFVEEMCKHFKYVLIIHGNHEYYDNDFEKTVKDWQDWESEGSPKNFHFLYNDQRILDGVRFLGGTMWTNFSDGDPIVMGAARQQMSDYSYIRNQGICITPQFILNENAKFMKFLLKRFEEPFDGPTVVMSHHSPGNELKRRGRLGDKIGPCYFANIEEMIGNSNVVKLWVHGHTHNSWDYTINETRVICNPYGYWGRATNKEFDRKITFEI